MTFLNLVGTGSAFEVSDFASSVRSGPEGVRGGDGIAKHLLETADRLEKTVRQAGFQLLKFRRNRV